MFPMNYYFHNVYPYSAGADKSIITSVGKNGMFNIKIECAESTVDLHGYTK